jgi:hypothetical protein
MRVLAVDGREVGRVKEVRPSDFLVDRRHAPDVYVAYQHVCRIDANVVQLDLDARQIDDASWREGPPAIDL